MNYSHPRVIFSIRNKGVKNKIFNLYRGSKVCLFRGEISKGNTGGLSSKKYILEEFYLKRKVFIKECLFIKI